MNLFTLLKPNKNVFILFKTQKKQHHFRVEKAKAPLRFNGNSLPADTTLSDLTLKSDVIIWEQQSAVVTCKTVALTPSNISRAKLDDRQYIGTWSNNSRRIKTLSEVGLRLFLQSIIHH